MTVQQPPKPDIDTLRAKVGAALDAVIAVEQGDDMAYSNGSYDRAMQVLLDATRVLTDALREESAE